jgi:hypothetical protein
VSVDVVVAVDMWAWILLGGGKWEGPAAQTAGRPVVARAWKSPWLVPLLGR